MGKREWRDERERLDRQERDKNSEKLKVRSEKLKAEIASLQK